MRDGRADPAFEGELDRLAANFPIWTAAHRVRVRLPAWRGNCCAVRGIAGCFLGAALGSCSGDDLRTLPGGERFTVSVQGTVTGFAADVIIIDDLLNASDAASPAERLRAQDFIDGSLPTRFDTPGSGTVIAIQQRLHEDDPAGYLRRKGYKHLNLPAIAETDAVIPIGRGFVRQRLKGELMFPEQFSKDVLDGLRRDVGSAVFSMQYQQHPVAVGGSPLRWE